jgi:hypothetical protein
LPSSVACPIEPTGPGLVTADERTHFSRAHIDSNEGGLRAKLEAQDRRLPVGQILTEPHPEQTAGLRKLASRQVFRIVTRLLRQADASDHVTRADE